MKVVSTLCLGIYMLFLRKLFCLLDLQVILFKNSLTLTHYCVFFNLTSVIARWLMSISKFNTTENKTKIQVDGKVITLSYPTLQKLLITLSMSKYSKTQIARKRKKQTVITIFSFKKFFQTQTLTFKYNNTFKHIFRVNNNFHHKKSQQFWLATPNLDSKILQET